MPFPNLQSQKALSFPRQQQLAYGYRFGANQGALVASNNYYDGQSFGELNEQTQILPLGVNYTAIFANPSTTIPGICTIVLC